MSRNLTAGQITNLERTVYKLEHLVVLTRYQMSNDALTVLTTSRYTTGNSTVSFGGNIYYPKMINISGGVEEYLAPQNQEFEIEFIEDGLINVGSYPFDALDDPKRMKVQVYALIRDDNNSAGVGTETADADNLFLIFEGRGIKTNVEFANDDASMTVVFGNEFDAFERQNGRTNGEFPNFVGNKELFWGQIQYG